LKGSFTEEKMRFLDANVMVYAYYRPRRELTEREKLFKDEAKQIVKGISEGKISVVTSVVHISEMVNALKHGTSLTQLVVMVRGLFMLDNVEILDVSRDECFAATELASELDLDPNDALAVQVMRSKNIEEICSFDLDLDKVEGVVRFPAI